MKVYRVVIIRPTFISEEREECFFLSKDKALKKLQDVLPKYRHNLREVFDGHPIIKSYEDNGIDMYYVEEINIED